MRNRCYFTLVLWLCTLETPFAFFATAQEVNSDKVFLRPRGDANLDSVVNMSDITTILDSVISNGHNYWCDVDYDGSTTVSDITSVIARILGNDTTPTASFSGTLPVVYINTANHASIESKEIYTPAQCFIDAMGIPGFNDFGSDSVAIDVRIRGRGNSSWLYGNKKPYKLKFAKKYAVLGFPKSKEFTLLPHIPDALGLKTSTAFALSDSLGFSYTPKQTPVELVLNGNYIGLYFFTEQIEVGTNRVNITEQDDYEEDSTKVTGGWLLEIDNYADENRVVVMEGPNKGASITIHSPENLSDKQKNYISQFLQKATDAIYNIDSDEWEKYIDIDAIAKFYILHEILDNVEAFSGSCYMTKERGDSSKLIFGPVWDVESTYGRFLQLSKGECHFIYDKMPDGWESHWIEAIAKHEHFQEVVRKYWKQFYPTLIQNLSPLFEEFASQVLEAAYSDYYRWPMNYNESTLSVYWQSTFPRYFKTKINWLNQQWGGVMINNKSCNPQPLVENISVK